MHVVWYLLPLHLGMTLRLGLGDLWLLSCQVGNPCWFCFVQVFRHFQTSHRDAVHPLCKCVPSRSHWRGPLFTVSLVFEFHLSWKYGLAFSSLASAALLLGRGTHPFPSEFLSSFILCMPSWVYILIFWLALRALTVNLCLAFYWSVQVQA